MGTGDLNVLLGRNVRLKRRAADLSQEEFAELCGLHRTYVGGIERGERNVTLNTVAKLAAALNVEAPELLRDPGA